jgi:hypothetical protein
VETNRSPAFPCVMSSPVKLHSHGAIQGRLDRAWEPADAIANARDPVPAVPKPRPKTVLEARKGWVRYVSLSWSWSCSLSAGQRSRPIMVELRAFHLALSVDEHVRFVSWIRTMSAKLREDVSALAPARKPRTVGKACRLQFSRRPRRRLMGHLFSAKQTERKSNREDVQTH